MFISRIIIPFLIFTFLLISFKSNSQVSFEKGYYINNSNKKIECLIKNLDWKNNPTEIEYKLSDNDNIQTVKIGDIIEFSVEGISKYLRVIAQIDRSSNNTSTLSNSSSPEISEEIVLLKALVEGKANLYQFEEGNLVKYFYQIDNSKIEPLIYKRYKSDDSEEISVNETYRGQLWASVKCDQIEYSRIKTIRYTEKSLVAYFSDVNTCYNSQQINYTSLYKKDLFNLNIRPGLKLSSAKFQNSSPNWREIKFDSKVGFRFGIEAEFILNYNNNKWALITEPTLQSYSGKMTDTYFNNGSFTQESEMEIKYTSLELPFGIRYYSFINSKSKVFTNLLFVTDMVLGDAYFDLDTSTEGNTYYEINSRTNFAVGVGYNYDSKLGIELRYHTGRTLLDHVSWTSDYNTVSVIVGYTLF